MENYTVILTTVVITMILFGIGYFVGFMSTKRLMCIMFEYMAEITSNYEGIIKELSSQNKTDTNYRNYYRPYTDYSRKYSYDTESE